MLAKERLATIKKMLERDGKVYVTKLCEIFDMSEDSIRKDLKILENQGLLERIYGGALAKESLNGGNNRVRSEMFIQRLAQHIPEKEIMAEKALNIIENGDVIYIDASSSNVILAQRLAESDKQITVVSNCLKVIEILAGANNIKLICPGGEYTVEVAGFSGMTAVRNLAPFYFDKTFIGVTAVDLSNGALMVDNYNDSELKSCLINKSKWAVLLCLSEKLGKKTTYAFGELEQVDTLIVEDTSKKVLERLAEFEIQIL